MPAGGRSFYSDMPKGARYGQFIADELPFLMKSLFHLSDRREDTFIAGQDMGGYGAFKTAISHPGLYAAAASLSGALDIGTFFSLPDDEIRQEMSNVFGTWDECLANGHRLPELLERAVLAGTGLPRLYQCCGTEDFLLEDNRRFASAASLLGVDLEYEEGPGEHGWPYWDAVLPTVLKWMHTCPVV
jgi:putative tributyrin esterase